MKKRNVRKEMNPVRDGFPAACIMRISIALLTNGVTLCNFFNPYSQPEPLAVYFCVLHFFFIKNGFNLFSIN